MENHKTPLSEVQIWDLLHRKWTCGTYSKAYGG